MIEFNLKEQRTILKMDKAIKQRKAAVKGQKTREGSLARGKLFFLPFQFDIADLQIFRCRAGRGNNSDHPLRVGRTRMREARVQGLW